jgi:carbon-monoxide dehydrogenase small subunit
VKGVTVARTISITLNGKQVTVAADGSRMLAYVLREDLHQTGTKIGCGQGLCGACTVLVNGEAVRSCSTPLEAVAGKEVTTIEGLGLPEKLHPVQEAFLEHHAFQCGFCTPGMILSTYALLKKTPKPDRRQVAEALDGNLCRCGAHVRILAAVEAAAAKGGAR